METTQKYKLNSPNTQPNQNSVNLSSMTPPSPRQSHKRFTRSGNNSRSKSKQHIQIQTKNTFFVKNALSEITDQTKRELFSKVIKDGCKSDIKKREVTPSKSRRQLKKYMNSMKLFVESQNDETITNDPQYHQIFCQKQRLAIINKDLQQKLTDTQIKLSQSLNYITELKQIIQLKESTKDNKPKSNNLTKLKKDIAKHHSFDVIPQAEALNEMLNKANAQITKLKGDLLLAQNALQAKQLEINKLYSERQQFLGELVHELRLQLNNKNETINRMRIQLNIFLVRQFKNTDKAQIIKNEEYLSIKRKYRTLLLKYHDLTKIVADHKRQRVNYLFSSSNQRDSESSFSLSP